MSIKFYTQSPAKIDLFNKKLSEEKILECLQNGDCIVALLSGKIYNTNLDIVAEFDLEMLESTHSDFEKDE
jgi:hypothetical protein